jgi:hypothetical protein
LIPLLFNFLMVIHGPFPSIKSKGSRSIIENKAIVNLSKGLEARSRTKQLSILPLNDARENLNKHP